MRPPTPGDVVTIYRDPVGERGPEGEAELIEPKSALDVVTGVQTWVVRFRDPALYPHHGYMLRRVRVRPQLVMGLWAPPPAGEGSP